MTQPFGLSKSLIDTVASTMARGEIKSSTQKLNEIKYANEKSEKDNKPKKKIR